MTVVLSGAFGLILGMAAHDLAIQSLDDKQRLRPFLGTCPTCGTERRLRRAVCPSCATRGWRELAVVLATGLVAAGLANTLGLSWTLLPYLGFVLLTSALLVTDLKALRIVDRLNLPGTLILAVLLAAASLVTGSIDALVRAALGGLAYFAGTLLMFVVVRGRGFGAGDVKLSFQLGLFTAYISWGTLGWAVFSTAMIGGVLALGLLVLGRAGRNTELPYGPPMILGAWLSLVLAGLGAFPVP